MTTQTVEYTGTEPITLADAKAFLRVTWTEDDAFIEGLISAARKTAEDATNLKIRPQNVSVVFSEHLPKYLLWGPVVSVTSVEWVNELGISATLPTSNYQIIPGTIPAELYLTSDELEDFRYLRVTYAAGFGSSPAPENVVQAMYHLIGEWYDNRGDGVRRFPTVARNLLNLNRVNYFVP